MGLLKYSSTKLLLMKSSNIYHLRAFFSCFRQMTAKRFSWAVFGSAPNWRNPGLQCLQYACTCSTREKIVKFLQSNPVQILLCVIVLLDAVVVIAQILLDLNSVKGTWTLLVRLFLPQQFSRHASNEKNLHFNSTFSSCNLEFWPMTLTYKLDLNKVKVNRLASYSDQRLFCLEVIIRAHKHTDKHTSDRSLNPNH